MKNLLKLILLVPLIQLASCNVQDSGSSKLKSQNSGDLDSEISSYNSTMSSSKGENGQILSAVDASTAVNSGSLTEEQKAAKLAEIDAKFQEVWDGLTADQQEKVKERLKGILKKVKDMSESDRKAMLKKLRPPLPSKTVLDEIVPAPAS